MQKLITPKIFCIHTMIVKLFSNCDDSFLENEKRFIVHKDLRENVLNTDIYKVIYKKKQLRATCFRPNLYSYK